MSGPSGHRLEISASQLAIGPFHARGYGSTLSQRNLVAEFPVEGTHKIALELGNVPFREILLPAEPGSVLDMVAYYNTLDLASDGGLFAISVAELEFSSRAVPAHRAVQDGCRAVNVGLGAVAVSCGSAGLRIIYEAYQSPERPATKVSDASLRAEIGYGSGVNHLSRSDFELLDAVTEESQRARRKMVTRANYERGANRVLRGAATFEL